MKKKFVVAMVFHNNKLFNCEVEMFLRLKGISIERNLLKNFEFIHENITKLLLIIIEKI